MYVQNISPVKPYNPNFTSLPFTYYAYKDCYGVKRETQNTTGERKDLNYKLAAETIENRFPGFERVNIMPMNVADGTEAYFIFKHLVEEVGSLENFERKYGCIAASDVCGNVLDDYPRLGLVNLSLDEEKKLRIFGEPMFEKMSDKFSFIKIQYTDPEQKHFENVYHFPYKLKPKFRKYFTFETCDFQKRLADLQDKGRSVVFIRNCLRQAFGDIESGKIVFKVARKLQGASLFITGEYDRGMELFEQALSLKFCDLGNNIWGKNDFATKTLQNLKNRLKFK